MRLLAAGTAALFSGAAVRCATAPASPAAEAVRVFHVDEPRGAVRAPLPAGCRLMAAHSPVQQTELELATSKFVSQRERAAASGGNVVLARREPIVPRQSYDCPARAPITDCPPSEGAWFRVVYEDYACSADAVSELSRPPGEH